MSVARIFREGGHCSKSLKNFWRKLGKTHYFSICFKNLTNHALIFARLDEKRKLLGNCKNILKVLDHNSLEKLNFYLIFYFGKFLTKNRAFGNNTIFLQQFFGFGGFPRPFPPGYALGPCINIISMCNLEWMRISTPEQRWNFQFFVLVTRLCFVFEKVQLLLTAEPEEAPYKKFPSFVALLQKIQETREDTYMRNELILT